MSKELDQAREHTRNAIQSHLRALDEIIKAPEINLGRAYASASAVSTLVGSLVHLHEAVNIRTSS